jgi:hypothetical protein
LADMDVQKERRVVSKLVQDMSGNTFVDWKDRWFEEKVRSTKLEGHGVWRTGFRPGRTVAR